jgi:hypothetical protein
MAIEFSCPSCGGTLRVEDDAIGQIVRCGGCMSMLRVPDNDSASTAFPEATATPFPEAEPASRRRQPANQPEEPVLAEEAIEEFRRPSRRKRSRREPPIPSGPSPLFWMLMTFCVLGVGSCTLCTGIAIVFENGEEDWQVHQSTAGGYQVEFPALPQKRFALHNLVHDPNMKVEGTRISFSGEEFAVVYKDLEPAEKKQLSERQILDRAVKDFTGFPGNRKQGDAKTLEVSGFPAREFNLQVGDEGSYVVRIVVADSRVYAIIAGNRFGRMDVENLQRFINSFQITDQKLLAASGERAERGQVPALGKALGEMLFQSAAAEAELAQLKALGVAVAGVPMRAVAAERAVALEKNRIGKIGLSLGKAVFGGVAKGLAEIDEQ